MMMLNLIPLPRSANVLASAASGRADGMTPPFKFWCRIRTEDLEGSTWHDLRHHHASVLLSNVVSPALVAERPVHDVKTLLSPYTHVTQADDDRVGSIVDASFGDFADFSRTGTG